MADLGDSPQHFRCPSLEELPQFPTAAQVARFFQVSEASLAQDRYLNRGLPYTRIGKRIRYVRDGIEKFLAENTVGQSDGQHA